MPRVDGGPVFGHSSTASCRQQNVAELRSAEQVGHLPLRGMGWLRKNKRCRFPGTSLVEFTLGSLLAV
jgi:hypothetical protein